MTETKTCHVKKHILVDTHVEAEMDERWSRCGFTPEQRANRLEEEVDKFVGFLRDHRSQDMISLRVVRDYKNLCSACGAEWYEDDDGDGPYCANCGAYLETEKGTPE